MIFSKDPYGISAFMLKFWSAKETTASIQRIRSKYEKEQKI